MVSPTTRRNGAPSTRRAPRPSSVQLKYVMAVSGAIMFGYLVAHMAGNLKIFVSQESLDTYGGWLRVVGEPALPERTVLWIVRVALLAAVIGHMVAATILARRAAKARPIKYAHKNNVGGSYVARTMRWGGVIIALFIVYHILDLTTGTLNPSGVHGEVYANVVADFQPQRWYVTLFYVIAIVAVALHLRHGLWSALQSFGRTRGGNLGTYKAIANGTAVLLAVGFLAPPMAVTLGLVG